MFLFDSRYLIFALPALLLAFYAQMKVSSAYKRYSRKPNARNLSGLEAAGILLRLDVSFIKLLPVLHCGI